MILMTTNTKTTIRTEYGVLGLKPDGTWRVINRQATAADAEKILEEYISDTKAYPDLYTAYAEYKVMKRNVITTIEDWSEI